MASPPSPPPLSAAPAAMPTAATTTTPMPISTAGDIRDAHRARRCGGRRVRPGRPPPRAAAGDGCARTGAEAADAVGALTRRGLVEERKALRRAGAAGALRGLGTEETVELGGRLPLLLPGALAVRARPHRRGTRAEAGSGASSSPRGPDRARSEAEASASRRRPRRAASGRASAARAEALRGPAVCTAWRRTPTAGQRAAAAHPRTPARTTEPAAAEASAWRRPRRRAARTPAADRPRAAAADPAAAGASTGRRRRGLERCTARAPERRPGRARRLRAGRRRTGRARGRRATQDCRGVCRSTPRLRAPRCPAAAGGAPPGGCAGGIGGACGAAAAGRPALSVAVTAARDSGPQGCPQGWPAGAAPRLGDLTLLFRGPRLAVRRQHDTLVEGLVALSASALRCHRGSSINLTAGIVGSRYPVARMLDHAADAGTPTLHSDRAQDGDTAAPYAMPPDDPAVPRTPVRRLLRIRRKPPPEVLQILRTTARAQHRQQIRPLSSRSGRRVRARAAAPAPTASSEQPDGPPPHPALRMARPAPPRLLRGLLRSAQIAVAVGQLVGQIGAVEVRDPLRVVARAGCASARSIADSASSAHSWHARASPISAWPRASAALNIASRTRRHMAPRPLLRGTRQLRDLTRVSEGGGQMTHAGGQYVAAVAHGLPPPGPAAAPGCSSAGPGRPGRCRRPCSRPVRSVGRPRRTARVPPPPGTSPPSSPETTLLR